MDDLIELIQKVGFIVGGTFIIFFFIMLAVYAIQGPNDPERNILVTNIQLSESSLSFNVTASDNWNSWVTDSNGEIISPIVTGDSGTDIYTEIVLHENANEYYLYIQISGYDNAYYKDTYIFVITNNP